MHLVYLYRGLYIKHAYTPRITRTIIAAMTTRAPTTPPAIAPTLVVCGLPPAAQMHAVLTQMRIDTH